MKRNTLLRGLAAVTACAMSSSTMATVTVNITQSGTDVVTSVSGTLDTTGLLPTYGTANAVALLFPANGIIGSGVFGQDITIFDGLTGPSSFGSGLGALATSSSGDPFFLVGSSGQLELSPSFVSGSSITSSATYASSTFASLGLTAGRYVYSTGTDSIIVNIGAAVPEPATWTMMLLGFVGMGAAMRRSRRRDMARVPVA